MNDRLLDILAQRPDFIFSADDKKLIDIFVQYLDRGSLFLFRFEPNPDPEQAAFVFTNEAQHYRFTMANVRRYVQQLKQGIPIDWEHMPFEYVERGEQTPS